MATIVMADDDENFATMIRAFLEEQGHVVHLAVDASDLFKVLTGKAPDLLILDLKMPGGGGQGAVKFLSETPRTAKTPIIILSMTPVEEQKKMFAGLAHIRFFSKPVELKALGAAVAELTAKPA